MPGDNMKVLEILSEAEQPTARSFDVQELVKTFKNKAEIEKHLRKLWGTDKLTFKGQPFFKGNDDGPVMKKARAAADRELKGDVEVTFEYKNEMDEFTVTVDEAKLVYMGYAERTGMLYLGYDIWLNNEEVEEVFDKLYKAHTGQEYDYDDPKLEKEWRDFQKKNSNFFGGFIEVSSADGKKFDADTLVLEPNGFYKGVKKERQFKSLDLVDLMNS
jgi:hypothetical protein